MTTELTGSDTLSAVNIVIVILCAMLTTSVSELATWFIVYRKEGYKVLKQSIESTQNKLNKAQEVYLTFSQQASQDKKVATIDKQLKALNQEMNSFKMKSTLLIAVFMIGALSSFGSFFSGTVVAKLPFVPFSLLTSMTHRGLAGEDLTDCAYIFIYVQMAYIWRTNIQKAFGFEPPKQPSPWGQAPAWGK